MRLLLRLDFYHNYQYYHQQCYREWQYKKLSLFSSPPQLQPGITMSTAITITIIVISLSSFSTSSSLLSSKSSSLSPLISLSSYIIIIIIQTPPFSQLSIQSFITIIKKHPRPHHHHYHHHYYSIIKNYYACHYFLSRTFQ